MTKELSTVAEPVHQVSTQVTPMQLLSIAMDQNADIDKLTKLMELQERWEASEAKKAYVKAMSEFKRDIPRITKDKHVKYGNTEYDHASLANVVNTLSTALSDYGLSHSWSTSQDDGIIKVTCIITHKDGHSESVSLQGIPDTSGAKNTIQAIGSTVSYLQRYTLLSATGAATSDMDDDAMSAEALKTEQQARQQALDDAIDRNLDSINAIKDFLSEDDYSSAYEAWHEISDDDKKSLWVAPTKFDNAPFTTAERSKMKSNEMNEARKQFNGVE